MRRELKFRVWDAEKKIMFSHDWLYSACVQYGALVNNPRKAINTMQFTGLLDKNGKEIYEGDIVQRGVILFGNGKFQGYYYESNGGIAEAWEDDLCQERNIEVLGNMYENPELMKSDF